MKPKIKRKDIGEIKNEKINKNDKLKIIFEEIKLTKLHAKEKDQINCIRNESGESNKKYQ